MASISRVLPHIAHVLQEQYRDVQTTLNIHHQSNEVRFNNLDTKVQHSINEIQPLHQLVTALGNEGLEIHKHVCVSQMGQAPLTPPSRPAPAFDPSMSVATDLITAPYPLDPEVPQYRMQLYVQSVVQLWEEYDRGISPILGQPRGPSIRALDDRYGSRWRRLDAVRKPYWRRKFIWQEVIAASENLGIPPEQLAERMDRWRSLGRISTISLNKLNDVLSAVAKNQEPLPWGPDHAELLHHNA